MRFPQSVLIGLVALAITLTAPLAATAQSPEDGPPIVGRIVGLVGTVTLHRGTDTMPATDGVWVAEADRLVTGAEARVEVRFTDGTRIVIGATSDVAVSDYVLTERGRRSRGVLSLLGGLLRAVVVPGSDGGGLDVRGRAAVASVRSTEFVVTETSEGNAVFTVDGLVAVTARTDGDDAAGPAPTDPLPRGAVLLGPGEGVDVPIDAAAAAQLEVKTWGQARVDRVLAATADP